jgi:hypothetical protein
MLPAAGPAVPETDLTRSLPLSLSLSRAAPVNLRQSSDNRAGYCVLHLIISYIYACDTILQISGHWAPCAGIVSYFKKVQIFRTLAETECFGASSRRWWWWCWGGGGVSLAHNCPFYYIQLRTLFYSSSTQLIP